MSYSMWARHGYFLGWWHFWPLISRELFLSLCELVKLLSSRIKNIDPRGRIPTSSDHYFRTCCPSIRPFVHHKTSKSSDNHCRPRWAGRVDHRWLLSCIILFFTFSHLPVKRPHFFYTSRPFLLKAVIIPLSIMKKLTVEGEGELDSPNFSQ